MESYNESAIFARNLIIKFFIDRMKELDISQYRLSKMTEISESNISRYFKKEIDMSLLNHLKICGALNIRPYFKTSESDDNSMDYRIHFN